MFTICPNERDKSLGCLRFGMRRNVKERYKKKRGTNHIVKRPVSQEMLSYCGKVGRNRLGFWLVVGASCHAVLAQAPAAFHRYFTNGEKILELNISISAPVSQPINACVTKVFMLLACQENPGPALFSGTCSTTTSMRERLGICGWIELQNYIHIRDI
jgi:hypothetical protein